MGRGPAGAEHPCEAAQPVGTCRCVVPTLPLQAPNALLPPLPARSGGQAVRPDRPWCGACLSSSLLSAALQGLAQAPQLCHMRARACICLPLLLPVAIAFPRNFNNTALEDAINAALTGIKESGVLGGRRCRCCRCCCCCRCRCRCRCCCCCSPTAAACCCWLGPQTALKPLRLPTPACLPPTWQARASGCCKSTCNLRRSSAAAPALPAGPAKCTCSRWQGEPRAARLGACATGVAPCFCRPPAARTCLPKAKHTSSRCVPATHSPTPVSNSACGSCLRLEWAWRWRVGWLTSSPGRGGCATPPPASPPAS